VSTWKTVVVGVDGSPGSRKALTWAATEAAEHGAELVVLNVWEHTLPPPAGSVSVSEHYVPDSSQRTADERVAEIKDALGNDPPVAVLPSVKQGNPAKVLIEQAKGADLLVVGTRGHGGFRSGTRLHQPARRRIRQVLRSHRPLTEHAPGARHGDLMGLESALRRRRNNDRPHGLSARHAVSAMRTSNVQTARPGGRQAPASFWAERPTAQAHSWGCCPGLRAARTG
jgi:nucleotide-binding universal stress UspA family protein